MKKKKPTQLSSEEMLIFMTECDIRRNASSCPFCGHDRIKFSWHYATGQDRGTKLVRIICARCKCGTNYEKTLREAEAAWNHRPNERMK